MDSEKFDSVKVEKANAIARFNRRRWISKLRHILEVFVALTLLSWSTTNLPEAVKISGEYILKSYIYFNRSPHIVFLIGNAIIVALFLLSRQNNSAAGINNNPCAGGGDIYDEYVESSNEAQHRVASSVSDCENSLSQAAALAAELQEVEAGSGKEMVTSELAVLKAPCDAVTSAIEEAKKQIKKVQRTQSEKLKQEIKMKPRRELRRSESEKRQIVDYSNCSGRLETTAFDAVNRLSAVNRLNDKEFRLKIEAFIAAEHQSFLKEQKMAEDDSK